jgi:UDP-N-acetylglucosamine--N-acetylmuramyl-(pentapeptide) pyrophosphoryl-undecaprenol N-acetylglucosamine transferase
MQKSCLWEQPAKWKWKKFLLPVMILWASRFVGCNAGLPFQTWHFHFACWQAWVKARNIIRKFKPDVVVGVGGYASGPIAQNGCKCRYSGCDPGTEFLSGPYKQAAGKKSQQNLRGIRRMDKYFPAKKIVLCGNPVRKDILNLKEKNKEAANYFNLDPNRKTLLITGGSLGARTINESTQKYLEVFAQNGFR